MSTTVAFSMDVEVHDPKALFKAALAKMIEDGVSPEEARVQLTDDQEEGTPDIARCVRYLADPGLSFPGTEIHDSFAEEFGI